MTKEKTMTKDSLPSRAKQVADEYPEIWKAYQALGQACTEAGPLNDRTRRLVKLALAIGARSEGAVHSHVRRGLEEGLTADDLRHVAVLAFPTLGFSTSVAALTWIEDLLDK
jgi:alkylhydroperoxidase/carboxymuconolactone decarboxylase family protein YurZ